MTALKLHFYEIPKNYNHVYNFFMNLKYDCSNKDENNTFSNEIGLQQLGF